MATITYFPRKNLVSAKTEERDATVKPKVKALSAEEAPFVLRKIMRVEVDNSRTQK